MENAKMMSVFLEKSIPDPVPWRHYPLIKIKGHKITISSTTYSKTTKNMHVDKFVDGEWMMSIFDFSKFWPSFVIVVETPKLLLKKWTHKCV